MIRINPQWPADWARSQSCIDSGRFLARCVVLHDWEDFCTNRIAHYFDKEGNLCLETFEGSIDKIRNYVLGLVRAGVCGRDGMRKGGKEARP